MGSKGSKQKLKDTESQGSQKANPSLSVDVISESNSSNREKFEANPA